jgi:hypothetical protein
MEKSGKQYSTGILFFGHYFAFGEGVRGEYRGKHCNLTLFLYNTNCALWYNKGSLAAPA